MSKDLAELVMQVALCENHPDYIHMNNLIPTKRIYKFARRGAEHHEKLTDMDNNEHLATGGT